MDNSDYETLIASAIRFVSFRPRSEKETRDFLTKKSEKIKTSEKDLVEKVVGRMRELGYVDDRKFVSWWVDQRNAFRPKGKRAISAELARRGISRELIEQESIDELGAARKAAVKKAVFWVKLPLIEQKKKLYTFLAQRGFSFEIIGRIIDEVFSKE